MLGEPKSVPCRGDCEDNLLDVFPDQENERESRPWFLERINGVFICFVAMAMRHCLKLWKSGVLGGWA